jgi:hypothetical protein
MHCELSAIRALENLFRLLIDSFVNTFCCRLALRAVGSPVAKDPAATPPSRPLYIELILFILLSKPCTSVPACIPNSDICYYQEIRGMERIALGKSIFYVRFINCYKSSILHTWRHNRQIYKQGQIILQGERLRGEETFDCQRY